MRFVTIEEASQMMGKPAPAVRRWIQLGKIPGAFTTGTKAKRTYHVTDVQIERMMKGEVLNEG